MKTIHTNIQYLLIALIGLAYNMSFAQNSITATHSSGEATIIKSTPTSNVISPIQTGQQFTYKIKFQNLNSDGDCYIEITDDIDSNLEIVSYTANNDFLDHSSTPVTGSGISRTGRRIEISTDPNHRSGSFDITVKYPCGSIPNNLVANNTFTANYVCNGVSEPINITSTNTQIATTSEAENPWGKISKEPFYPVINNEIPASNPIANYEIVIEKDDPFQYNYFGMLDLEDVKIDENFPSCATLTVLSVNNGNNYTLVGNQIQLTNPLKGCVNQPLRLNVQVDYSGCGFVDGDCVNNQVVLNGKPTGNSSTLNNIATADAEVCVVDNLGGTLGSQHLYKSVTINNPVPGCKGQYCVTVAIDRNGRPMRMIDIQDQLPNEITPISASINTNFLPAYASTPRIFDINLNTQSFNSFDLDTGAFGNTFPSNPTGNSFSIVSQPNTYLYPGESITICVPFYVNPGVTVGQDIDNCATLSGIVFDTTNPNVQQINEQHCAQFTIEEPKVKLCIQKEVRNVTTSSGWVWPPNVNAKPTDVIEFRIRVQNNGSLNFTGDLTDALDNRYDFISASGGGVPTSGNTIEWQNINLQQNCSANYVSSCFANSSGQTFTLRVRVKANTPPGNIDNQATISDGTLSRTSNFAKVNVISAQVLKVTKGVNNGSGNYVSNLTINPTLQSTLQYRIRVENLGNVEIKEHQLIDDLPGPGDVWYPAVSSPRGSDFPLTNYRGFLFNSGYDDFFKTNWYSSINCVDISTWLPTYTIGDKSLLFDTSTNYIPVAGVRDFYFTADISSPATRVNGEKVVNSSYFLFCNPDQIAPAVRSNKVTVNMFIPPCTSCEDDGNFEASSNTAGNWTTINEAPVHSEGNGIEVYTESYNLSTDWNWITKVRIFMSELEPISEDGCESCHYNMDQVGNFVYNDFPTTLGGLTKESINYSGATQEFAREIVYSGLPTTAFNSLSNPGGVNSLISIAFPDFNPLQCCGTKYKGCIKFVFEGPNCENCVQEYCFDTDGQLFPPLCEPINVNIEEEKLGCCSTILIPQITGGGSFPVYYEWFNDITGNSIQGPNLITNTDKGQLAVTEDGTYRIEVWYDCPDGTRYRASTTYMVTGILPPLSTTTAPRATLAGFQRFNSVSSGRYATLDLTWLPGLSNYKVRVSIEQEVQDFFPPYGRSWVKLNPNPLFDNGSLCSSNLPSQFTNIKWQKGNRLNGVGGPWQIIIGEWKQEYRVIIEWEDCQQNTVQEIIPINGPLTPVSQVLNINNNYYNSNSTNFN